MRKLIAVLLVLAALVAALLSVLRGSKDAAPLAMDTPAVVTSRAEPTLAASDTHAELARKLVDTPSSPIDSTASKPITQGPRAHIFGRVIDARGAPVDQAEVRIYARHERWSRTEPLEPDKPADRNEERSSTTTDAGGAFSFDAPVPTARFVTVEVIPNSVLRRVELGCGGMFNERPEIVVGENDLGEILVGPASAVTGRVVDEAGAGIAGAWVSVKMLDGESRTESARTDEDGLFTVTNLAPGNRALSVSASGRRKVPDVTFVLAAGETKQIEAIVLARGSTIAGFVVDESGMPVEQIGVRARSIRGNSSVSAMTDARGAFQITLSADDPHTLSIGRSEKWAGLADPEAAKAEYEPGREGVRLVVKPTNRITFRVTRSADGSPIERFGLELRRKLPPGTTTTQDDVVLADHPGGTVAMAVDPATQMLVVDAPGCAPVESDIVLDAGSADTQTIALGPEGVIVGSVFVGKAPAVGARVVVTRESWRANGSLTSRPSASESNSRTDVGPHAGRERTAITGTQGEFRFDMLATGTYALAVRAEGGAPGLEREIGVVAGRTTDVGQIQVALGGTLRGRLILPPDQSPIGYGIAITALGRDHFGPGSIDMRQVMIASMDGRFEFRGLEPATWCAQWTLPGVNGFSFGDGAGMPQAVVSAGSVAEIVLDASNTSPCTVAVRVLRRGEPFVGAKVWAMTQMRGQPKTWSSVKVGITNAEGFAEGPIEGGLRFRLQLYESEKGPLLVDSSEELEAVPRGRIEREFRIETGTLVLVLPADLVPPEKGGVSVTLSSPSAMSRSINLSTPGWRPSRDRLEWKGSVIPLGPVAAGAYTVRVNVRRYEADSTKPGGFAPTDLRPEFTTEIEVRADAETRIEVK